MERERRSRQRGVTPDKRSRIENFAWSQHTTMQSSVGCCGQRRLHLVPWYARPQIARGCRAWARLLNGLAPGLNPEHLLRFIRTLFDASPAARARRPHAGLDVDWVNSGFVAQRIADWLRGSYQVLFANRMLTEGFDCPRLLTECGLTKAPTPCCCSCSARGAHCGPEWASRLGFSAAARTPPSCCMQLCCAATARPWRPSASLGERRVRPRRGTRGRPRKL